MPSTAMEKAVAFAALSSPLTLSATAQVAQENVQLKSEVSTTEKRLDALEEDFRKAQTEAPFTAPTTPSVKGTNDW